MNRQSTWREAKARPAGEEPAPEPAPGVFLQAAAEQFLAAESQVRLEPTIHPPAQTPSEKRDQQMWAIAMAKHASEITASPKRAIFCKSTE